MDQEDKINLRNNVIKFIIGLILLGFSFNYMNNHPAEKASITSGFEVMYQKVQIFFHKMFKDDAEILERRYSLLKYYEELVRTAEDKGCLDVDILSDLHETYENFQEEDSKTIKDSLSDYMRKAYKFDAEVKKDCK